MTINNPKLTLTFLGEDVSASTLEVTGDDIEKGSITSTFQLFSSLKSSSRQYKLTLKRKSKAVESIIRTEGDIKAVLSDDNGTLFSGYLSTNYSWTLSDSGEQDLSITIEDNGSKLLGKPFIKSGKHLFKCTAYNAVKAICDKCGIELSDNAPSISTEIVKVVSEGDTCKDILSTLLYETGYVYFFENDGKMNLFSFLSLPTTESVSLDGTSLIVNGSKAITLSKKVRQYKSAKVKFTELGKAENYLVYRNTTGQDASHKYCNLSLKPNEAFDGAEIYTIDPTVTRTATLVEAVNAESETELVGSRDIIAIENVSAQIEKNSNISASITGAGGPYLQIEAENKSSNTYAITRLDAYADIVYEKAQGVVIGGEDTDSSDNTLEEELTYIHDKDNVEKHANLLTSYYKYSGATYTFYSREDIDCGSVVKINDDVFTGLSVLVLVYAKTETDSTGMVEYKAVGYSEFNLDKTTIVQRQLFSPVRDMGAKGEKGDTGATGAQGIQGIQGEKGEKGDTGATGSTGVGISTIVEYYAVSSSNSKAPTSWDTSVPTLTATNKYLWNYEVITYTDSSKKETAKRVIGVYGDKGATGAQGPQGEKGDTGATGAKGDTGEQGPKGDIGSRGLQGEKGDTGEKGETGATGNGIAAITNYYLASTASTGVTTSTSGWTTTVQSVTATKKYLWNYEKITYTNSTPVISTPCIIGVYGDKGDTGAKGDKGDTGAQGPQGEKGDTGAKGDKGDTGAQGPQGEKGDTGAKGDKGDTGATGAAGKDYWQKKEWIDLSASTYDVDTWYPVIGTPLASDGYVGIKVVVNLNSGTKPSWSTHSSGFSVDFHIDTQRSGWGTTNADTIIYSDTYKFCSVSPTSYTQMTYASIPVLYLRGGGKYYVQATYAVTWTIKPEGYTWTSGSYTQTVSPASSRPTPMGRTLKGDKGDTGSSVTTTVQYLLSTSSTLTEAEQAALTTWVDGASLAWSYGYYIYKRIKKTVVETGAVSYTYQGRDTSLEDYYNSQLSFSLTADRLTYVMNKRASEDETTLVRIIVNDRYYKPDSINWTINGTSFTPSSSGGVYYLSIYVRNPLSSYTLTATPVKNGTVISGATSSITLNAIDETEKCKFFGAVASLTNVGDGQVLLEGDGCFLTQDDGENTGNLVYVYENDNWVEFNTSTLSADTKALILAKAQETALEYAEVNGTLSASYAYLSTLIANFVYSRNIGAETIMLTGDNGKLVGGDWETEDDEGFLVNKGVYIDSDGKAKLNDATLKNCHIDSGEIRNITITGIVDNDVLTTTLADTTGDTLSLGSINTTNKWYLGSQAKTKLKALLPATNTIYEYTGKYNGKAFNKIVNVKGTFPQNDLVKTEYTEPLEQVYNQYCRDGRAINTNCYYFAVGSGLAAGTLCYTTDGAQTWTTVRTDIDKQNFASVRYNGMATGIIGNYKFFFALLYDTYAATDEYFSTSRLYWAKHNIDTGAFIEDGVIRVPIADGDRQNHASGISIANGKVFIFGCDSTNPNYKHYPRGVVINGFPNTSSLSSTQFTLPNSATEYKNITKTSNVVYAGGRYITDGGNSAGSYWVSSDGVTWGQESFTVSDGVKKSYQFTVVNGELFMVRYGFSLLRSTDGGHNFTLLCSGSASYYPTPLYMGGTWYFDNKVSTNLTDWKTSSIQIRYGSCWGDRIYAFPETDNAFYVEGTVKLLDVGLNFLDSDDKVIVNESYLTDYITNVVVTLANGSTTLLNLPTDIPSDIDIYRKMPTLFGKTATYLSVSKATIEKYTRWDTSTNKDVTVSAYSGTPSSVYISPSSFKIDGVEKLNSSWFLKNITSLTGTVIPNSKVKGMETGNLNPKESSNTIGAVTPYKVINGVTIKGTTVEVTTVKGTTIDATTVNATTLNGKATSAVKITDDTMTVYSEYNNEVNFGGSNASSTIYLGYRAKDSKAIPTLFVFGGSGGSSTLQATKFNGNVNSSGTSNTVFGAVFN